MKKPMHVLVAAFLLSIVSAGCYTQLASRESSRDDNDNEEAYVSSDTSGTQANCGYFGDDDYRQHRYSLSFNYYHPGRWAYYDGFYDPWIGDTWYWSMGWRPYVLYPYPTWYPYGSYYGNNYYGGYYNGGWSHGTFADGGRGVPNRPRFVGTTRGDDMRGLRARVPLASPSTLTQGNARRASGIRTRTPIVMPPTSAQSTATGASGIRTRGSLGEQGVSSASEQAQPANTRGSRTRRNDVPWWERAKQLERNTVQNRAVTTQPATEQPAVNTGRQRRVEQTQGSNTGTTRGTGNQVKREQRERNSRDQGTRQHVSPSSQQSQPRSSPPASNGGGGRERSGGSSSNSGSSSGGGTRQRER